MGGFVQDGASKHGLQSQSRDAPEAPICQPYRERGSDRAEGIFSEGEATATGAR